MSQVLSLGLGREGSEGNPDFRLEVGSVVGRTFSVWLANFVPFCLVGLVAYAPALCLIWLMSGLKAWNPLSERFVDLLGNLLSILLSGAVTYGVFRHLHGERAEVGEVLRMGLSRFGAVWVTGIVYALSVGIGLILLIIPGIVIAIRYWLAVPVAVIEAPGAMASLERSRELTEGNRWRVLRVAIILTFLMFVGMMICGILGYAVGTAISPDALTAGGVRAPTPPLAQAFILVFMIPIQTLIAVAPVVAYHDLRVGKEGAEVEDLLKVFA